MAFLADLSQVGGRQAGRQAGLKAEAEATWQPCFESAFQSLGSPYLRCPVHSLAPSLGPTTTGHVLDAQAPNRYARNYRASNLSGLGRSGERGVDQGGGGTLGCFRNVLTQ